MSSLLVIFFNSIFVKNIVLTQLLGVCSFLGVSRDTNIAAKMGGSVTLIMLLATALTWPIHNLILTPYGLNHLQTLVFILMIASVVQILMMVMKKFRPDLDASLGIHLPLIATNCAILGIVLINTQENYTFAQALISSLGTGIGYLLVITVFSSIRTRLEDSAIPASLKGLPILLVAASIMALAFVGFSGVAEGLFT